MITPQGSRLLLGTLAALSAGTASAVDVAGPEIELTDRVSELPNVACAADGRCLAVWADYDPDLLSTYRGQWIRADGSRDGAPLVLVQPTAARYVERPDIAMAADGSFVLVFRMPGPNLTDGGYYRQWFDADGHATTPRARIREAGFAPAVAMDSDGDAVIVSGSRFCPSVYVSDVSCNGTIVARRYAKDGTLRDWHPVRTFSSTGVPPRSVIGAADVAMDPDGDFAVAWSEQTRQAVNGRKVMARTYSATTGAATGPAFAVDAFSDYDPRQVRIAGSGDGHFMAVWETGGTQYLRPFSMSAAVGARVALEPGFRGFEPRVAAAAHDEFVVVSGREYDDPGTPAFDPIRELRAQRYDVGGQTVGERTTVGVATFGNQDWPEVDGSAQGGYAVTWRTLISSGVRLYAQRLAPPRVVRGPREPRLPTTSGCPTPRLPRLQPRA